VVDPVPDAMHNDVRITNFNSKGFIVPIIRADWIVFSLLIAHTCGTYNQELAN
jgi:hypothetical protein